MVKKNKKISCAILIIGNEILSGRTKDQNVSFLASWLNSNLGIKIEEVRIVPDIEKKHITIPGKSIKRLGKYVAKIRIHREVSFEFPFEVIPEEKPKK